jgi:hypothetical protein
VDRSGQLSGDESERNSSYSRNAQIANPGRSQGNETQESEEGSHQAQDEEARQTSQQDKNQA